MSRLDETLLSPTIANEGPVRLYSSTAGMYVAFFGGFYATILFNFLNSKKLKRLKIDIPIYILWLLVGTWALSYLFRLAKGQVELPWGGTLDKDITRYISRGLGLIAYAGFYFLHKKYHSANENFGIEPLNPWVPGIICSAAGFILTMLVFSAY